MYLAQGHCHIVTCIWVLFHKEPIAYIFKGSTINSIFDKLIHLDFIELFILLNEPQIEFRLGNSVCCYQGHCNFCKFLAILPLCTILCENQGFSPVFSHKKYCHKKDDYEKYFIFLHTVNRGE